MKYHIKNNKNNKTAIIDLSTFTLQDEAAKTLTREMNLSWLDARTLISHLSDPNTSMNDKYLRVLAHRLNLSLKLTGEIAEKLPRISKETITPPWEPITENKG